MNKIAEIVRLNSQRPDWTVRQITQAIPDCSENVVRRVGREYGLTFSYEINVGKKIPEGINCEVCGCHNVAVIDSRPTTILGFGIIRRRRRCLEPSCDHRFTTYEMHADRIEEIGSANRKKALAEVLTELMAKMT